MSWPQARVCTEWPSSLFQTSLWHWNKGCVLVHGPDTKTEFLFWCQWEVWSKLFGHLVHVFRSRRLLSLVLSSQDSDGGLTSQEKDKMQKQLCLPIISGMNIYSELTFGRERMDLIVMHNSYLVARHIIMPSLLGPRRMILWQNIKWKKLVAFDYMVHRSRFTA